MNVPVWAAELASTFWTTAGEPEPFPRNLRNAIARAVPLTVVSLPGLGIDAVSRWLQNVKVPCRIALSDRPLHGMLVTYRGHGFVFLNGVDDADEQRFSLAHELAHYLRDDWRPRRRMRRQFGEIGLSVLDGDRSASVEERLIGAIAGLPLGCRVHLLERNADGTPVTLAISVAERDADRLAFELLAPASHVARASLCQRPRIEWADILQKLYGLPKWAAEQYVELLVPAERADPLLGSLTCALRD